MLADRLDVGLWKSFGTTLRLIVGWFSVTIGSLNLLVELDRRSASADLPYLLFHTVLVLGGALLLALGRLRPAPGPPGYLAGGVTFAGGALASALPVTTTVCCLPGFAVRHGFPFTAVARDTGAGRWHVDSQHLLADLLFWGYVGLFVLVVTALVRVAGARTRPRHAH